MKSGLLTLSFATLLCLTSLESEAAKRLGGGQSVGRQSSNVTQREAARPAPAAPTQNQAAPAAQPTPSPAAACNPVCLGITEQWVSHHTILYRCTGSCHTRKSHSGGGCPGQQSVDDSLGLIQCQVDRSLFRGRILLRGGGRCQVVLFFQTARQDDQSHSGCTREPYSLCEN